MQLQGSVRGWGEAGRKDGGQSCFLLETPQLNQEPSKAGQRQLSGQVRGRVRKQVSMQR